MCCQKQRISMPQSNHHNCNRNCNNIGTYTRNVTIYTPTCWIVYVTNFHYFQVINTSNLSIKQGNKHWNQKLIVQTRQENGCFPQKPIYRRKPRQTCHQYSPGKSGGCTTLIQCFQIPNILRTCFLSTCRSSHWPHNQCPHSKVHDCIKNHVSPQRTNSIGCINPRSRSVCTQWHQKQSHVSNTTIGQQTFKIGLRQRCQCSNSHGKNPKEPQSIRKAVNPQVLPVMSPKSKNSNFRQYCNPQTYARPSTHIHIRNPKMQRCCRLFPKKSHGYKPYTKHLKQTRFSFCASRLPFNMRNCCFPGLPIKQSNSLKQQTTPKSTQLEIFHGCFNRIGTFVIQSTKHHQRKTLQFQTKVHGHQICRLNLQILAHQCLHCQIHIFSMPNCCNFLPVKAYTKHKTRPEKQKSTLKRTIQIFLKTSSQKDPLQRTKPHQKHRKTAPNHCPQTQSTCCVIWPCRGNEFLFNFSNFFKGKTSNNWNYFCNWCNKPSSTISKLNLKAKKHKKFRPHNYQIQSHFTS